MTWILVLECLVQALVGIFDASGENHGLEYILVPFGQIAHGLCWLVVGYWWLMLQLAVAILGVCEIVVEFLQPWA